MAKKDVTKPISLDPRGGRPREKCVTYIEGIDRILNGGLPIGNIVLLAGTVGSGKTTLAMEYLINGAKKGETCCYISVTEPSSKMLSNLRFVNLKFIDNDKFIFFTNYNSPKSLAFETHNQISGLFFWEDSSSNSFNSLF